MNAKQWKEIITKQCLENLNYAIISRNNNDVFDLGGFRLTSAHPEHGEVTISVKICQWLFQDHLCPQWFTENKPVLIIIVKKKHQKHIGILQSKGQFLAIFRNKEYHTWDEYNGEIGNVEVLHKHIRDDKQLNEVIRHFHESETSSTVEIYDHASGWQLATNDINDDGGYDFLDITYENIDLKKAFELSIDILTDKMDEMKK